MTTNTLSSLFLASNVSIGLAVGLIIGAFVVARGIGTFVSILV